MRKTLMIAAAGVVLAVGGATAAVEAASATPITTQSVTATRASTAIDQAAARNIATATVPGGTVTEIALLDIQGRSVWKVHVDTATTRQEVFIDATSGRIVSTEQSGGGRASASPSETPATTVNAEPDPDADDSNWRERGGLDDGPGHDLGDDHGSGGR